MPPSKSERTLFIDRVRYLNLSDVYLFINRVEEREFVLSTAKEERIVRAAAMLRENGIRPHLTTWLRPTVSYVEACARRLYQLCYRGDIEIASLQFDAEATWWRSSSGGGVAKALNITRDHWPFHDWPCALGVTSYGSFKYFAASALEAIRPLIARCDYVVPQAYSTAGEKIRYRRPGVTQRAAHENWRNIILGMAGVMPPVPVFVGAVKPISMGLAAYNLTRVDDAGNALTQRQAMQVAVEAVEDLTMPHVDQIIYWSLNNLVASVERAEFVRAAGRKAARAISQRNILPATGEDESMFQRAIAAF